MKKTLLSILFIVYTCAILDRTYYKALSTMLTLTQKFPSVLTKNKSELHFGNYLENIILIEIPMPNPNSRKLM